MLALLLRAGRAPSFLAGDTPRQHDEEDLTPPEQLEETRRIVNAFCERHSALRIVPTEQELTLFWTQCSNQPTAGLTTVLSERLLCTVAEDDRHTQVRLLYALGHFFDTGMGARKVANCVLDETNELVNYLATEVSDSRELASNLLKQWQLDGGHVSVECTMSPHSASSTDLAPTESEGQETLTQTDQSEGQDWSLALTAESAAVPKAAGPLVALPPPRASPHAVPASSPCVRSVPNLSAPKHASPSIRPARSSLTLTPRDGGVVLPGGNFSLGGRSQSAQCSPRPTQPMSDPSLDVSWPMALDGIDFAAAPAEPPRASRHVPKTTLRPPPPWRANLGPEVPLAEEVEIWRAPDPFARFNPLDGCQRSVHTWEEDDGGFSTSRCCTGIGVASAVDLKLRLCA